MPKALIVGASGMLGHKALRVFSEAFEVAGTVRRAPSDYPMLSEFRLIGEISAEDLAPLEKIVRTFSPDVVLNCIAITASRIPAADAADVRRVNSDFPHAIARLCAGAGCYLVHVSTDAVFSGEKGDYRETDTPDPIDLYGCTKRAGEIDAPGALTVRTSMFGRQLIGQDGLIEWLKSEKGNAIKGFRNAIFSGLPTVTLCETLREIALRPAGLHGVLHIGAPAISKFELLGRLNDAMNLGLTITPVDVPRMDRSLNCDLFRQSTGMAIPDWPGLIEAFAADDRTYA